METTAACSTRDIDALLLNILMQLPKAETSLSPQECLSKYKALVSAREEDVLPCRTTILGIDPILLGQTFDHVL
jgi:hypothetical protein